MIELAADPLPTHQKAIDITAETCPMTFVRTRLALDSLNTGDILLVRLRGAESVANVASAAADHGHDPLELTEQPDGAWLLVLKKG